MDKIFHWSYQTPFPVGKLTFGVTGGGMAILGFHGLKPYAKSRAFANAIWEFSEEKTRPYYRQVEEYLKGRRREFTLKLDLRGTEFQMRCWTALMKIPYGEAKTYAEIAAEVDCPKGFRAVGMANNRNPVAIVVPCHRVIEANGRLGGYGGGLPAKEWLLKLEGAEISGADLQTGHLFA
ncbi:MAG TPA: methylated-DNA--[protein]-cysteine S-methyltransferase [Terriglobales bacterium]|nr:methylated-DNA--[protein]-cysteine S-methyltransferase [Terriglobales bacterium]